MAVVLAGAGGCRHSCGDRCGAVPVARAGGGRSAACADPVVGLPVGNGGVGSAGMLIPGSGGSLEQLPPPAELNLPRMGVPTAPPVAAPPPVEGLGSLLPAPKTGVPVKAGN